MCLQGAWHRPVISIYHLDMSAEQFVQASYRGLELGGERLKLFDFGPTTAHLECTKPLPNGTALKLETEDGVEIAVTVIRVHEQVGESSVPAGMRVRADGLKGAAKKWWKGLAGSDDPVIPEPALEAKPLDESPPEPVAEPAAEAPAADAAPEPAADTAPEPEAKTDEAVPEMVEDQVTNPVEARTSTKKTQIMNVAEIQAAIAEDEAAENAGGGNGAKTQQMSTAEVEAALAAEAAAKPAEDDKKKKKKRRKKKKR